MLCWSSVVLEMSKTMTSFRDDDGIEIRVAQLMGCLIFFVYAVLYISGAPRFQPT